MSISRRNFLKNSAAASAFGVAATTLPGCGGGSQSPGSAPLAPGVATPASRSETPFLHSVASGDPTETSAIIWTRLSNVDADGNPELRDTSVDWAVYSDPELSNIVAAGTTSSLASNDNCAKVDVTGLSPYTAYYYQFSVPGFTSPIGRLQTLPDWPADTDNRLRVAIVSCSNFPHGYFHVYREVAERNDIDLVVHLGDYIYEYGNGEYGDTRDCDPPHEMISLDDYRRRHAQYKTDPDLVELHRQYTFVNIWDDHETTDNSRKCTANNHTEAAMANLQPGDEGFNEGYWYERKTFGIQAYFEWLPIRPVADDATVENGALFSPRVGKTWRKFSAGKFLDLIMVDTRLWGRDDQADGAAFQRDAVRDYQSSDPLCGDTTAHRDILGPDQEQWLHEQLRNSEAKWKVIGNQLIMSHLRTTPGVAPTAELAAVPATYLNTDAWDGYPTSQERLYEVLQGNNQDGSENADASAVDNVVVITGDIHTSWAFDVTPNPDQLPAYEPIAVEFVGPSVSSPGIAVPEQGGEAANVLSVANTHLKYVNLDQRGWVLLDLSPTYATGEWYHIGGDAVVDSPDRPAPGSLARVYRTSAAAGENGLEIDATDPTGTLTKQTDPGAAYLQSRPAMSPTATDDN